MKKSEYSGIENCNPSQWLLQPTVLHPVFWHGYSKALDITHKIPNAVCLCARCTPSQWNAVYLYYTPRRFIAIYKVAIGSRTKDLPEKTDNLIYYTWPLQRAVAFHSITNSHFSKDSWEEMTQRVIVSLSIWIPLCHHLQDGRKAEEPGLCWQVGKAKEEAASSILVGHWEPNTSGHLFSLSSQCPQEHRLWHRSSNLSREMALKMPSFDHTFLCVCILRPLC